MRVLADTEDGLSPATDSVYDALIATHEGLSEEQSHALNARLVLMLANEVGDPERLLTLFAEARAAGERRDGGGQA